MAKTKRPSLTTRSQVLGLLLTGKDPAGLPVSTTARAEALVGLTRYAYSLTDAGDWTVDPVDRDGDLPPDYAATALAAMRFRPGLAMPPAYQPRPGINAHLGMSALLRSMREGDWELLTKPPDPPGGFWESKPGVVY